MIYTLQGKKICFAGQLFLSVFEIARVLIDEMSGDYGNVMFCGGSTILEAEMRKNLEDEVLNKDDGKGKTMGDAFNEVSSSLSASIVEDGNGNSVGMKSESEIEIMETPREEKVTKEILQARMLQLQKDFQRLEEEELQDSPAQTVKKRKRRKSSGKGKDV